MSLLLGLAPATAQERGTCAQSAGPRPVLTCPDGLTITLEPGSRLQTLAPSDKAGPAGATLTGGAILIEAPRRRSRPFQIETPMRSPRCGARYGRST